MALKIVLVIALACMSQALARGPLYDARPPCKPVSESAEVIPHEFEKALMELDYLGETFIANYMEHTIKNDDIGVIIACLKEQRGPYMALGNRMANLTRAAVKELAKDLGDKYEAFVKRAEVPIKNIANTMMTLPRRMWALIKNQEFGKVVELIRESRRIVEQNAIELAKIMRELRQELPEVADKAEKLFKEIREEGRKGSRQIAENFRKCVEAGGPTPKPTTAAPTTTSNPSSQSYFESELDELELESEFDIE